MMLRLRHSISFRNAKLLMASLPVSPLVILAAFALPLARRETIATGL